MSIFFKAHGSPSIGLLIIRLAVGIYTLSLGIMQANNVEAYIAKIKAMQIVSENTAFIFGFVTPFLLIIFGTLYIMGFFTPVTSSVLAFVQFLKIISRGLLIGAAVPFNKDVIILACFLLTLFAGAGVISFDAFLDKRKKKVILPAESKVVTAEIVSEPKTEIISEQEIK
jgi:uncharacterized membrane protein YphA (DoxX/SURF4 family)